MAYASLAVSHVTVGNSLYRGQTFKFNPLGNFEGGVPVNDREWMGFIGTDRVYLVYRNFGRGLAFIQQSNDGGVNYGPAIIVTGNLGYILAHVFALSAFVLLRRDRPGAPRPIRLPGLFVPLAGALAVFVLVMLVVGATSFSITGYGGTRELVIALALLASSLLLYAYRRHVQDRGGPGAPPRAEEPRPAPEPQLTA